MSARTKSVVFISKSMLWSLLLYMAAMLAFNWDEVSTTKKGKNAVTIVSHAAPAQGVNEPCILPANITHGGGNIQVIAGLLKNIAGLVKTAAGIYSGNN
jgi:hypothetical protein